MAKNLVLTFATQDGSTTTMSISDDVAKQTLDSQAVKSAMDAMVASQAFANSKGSAYTAARKAAYVETTETSIYTAE